MHKMAKRSKRKEPVTAAVRSRRTPDPAAEPISSAQPAVSIITLEANCSLRDAAALKNSLAAAVEISDRVVLDAASVERVDTATMQLLCAFVRERAANNRSVVWHEVSAALSEAAQLLGVQSLLGLPPESAGAAA